MLTREKVYEKVAATLCDVLNVELDEVVPKATLQGDLGPESIVLCITGQGLKTQEAVMDHIGKPIRIKPTLASFEENVRS